MKIARFALASVLVGALLSVDSVAFSDPDAVAKAKEQLDAISAQVSEIEQEGIEASAKAEEAKTRMERATEDLEAQEKRVIDLADQIGGSAVLQMQQGQVDFTLQLLTRNDAEGFLSTLATVQSENERSSSSLQALQNDQARLEVLRVEAAQAKREMDENLATQQAKLTEYQQKETEAQRIYDRLSKEERDRLDTLRREAEERRARESAQREEAARRAAAASASRDSERPAAPSASQQAAPEEASDAPESAPTSAPAASSGRVQTVINAAVAQVGKRYVYATSGPNTFDCSGLTSYAYRQIGISLPRSSRAQYSGAGRRVPVSEIQPGDLVFYYGGPSHVGLYIGNGKIVHAANPRTGINITGLHSMPLKGVVRVL